jgi:hypothetical protein
VREERSLMVGVQHVPVLGVNGYLRNLLASNAASRLREETVSGNFMLTYMLILMLNE